MLVASLQKFALSGFFGILLIITGIFDSLKYTWAAKKIRNVGSSKGHSRNFINVAITNDLVRLLYFIFVDRDVYLILVSIIALYCMFDMFFAIYINYPYRMRGCSNFKRPNILLYFINSILPNRIRRKL
jgi:hypothetical protein